MAQLPQHVAIVMDGNGRWAEQRKRPRNMGHQAGVRALKTTVEHAAILGISTLTVFAFSSENWRRPKQEVSRLMDLFLKSLDKELATLHENQIRVCFIGHLAEFPEALQKRMDEAERITRDNERLRLNVAVNYGGRWDVVQAARKLAKSARDGDISIESIDESQFGSELSTAGQGDPDLLIRTGGELRISNFLLWQCAYTEFHFTPVLWPDFGREELEEAIEGFRARERRFGLTSKQLKKSGHA